MKKLFLENIDPVVLKEARERYANAYRAIRNWRRIALEEQNNRVIGEKRISHRCRLKKSYLTSTRRPFFVGLDRNDPIYIRTYRMIVYDMMRYSPALKAVVMKASGYNLGRMLVEKSIIRSMDDLPHVFIAQRIGLLDLENESTNKMRINIYECMSCSGMEAVGIPMCDFEAGVIEGVLEQLIGKNTTREKYCWGLGYSFCGFETYFE